jgi:hypothetical protein
MLLYYCNHSNFGETANEKTSAPDLNFSEHVSLAIATVTSADVHFLGESRRIPWGLSGSGIHETFESLVVFFRRPNIANTITKGTESSTITTITNITTSTTT